MTEIIIVTHGGFGNELYKSAQMIVGEYENVKTLGFYPTDLVDDLKEKVDRLVKDTSICNQKLILVDLFAGSPFNASVPQLANPNVEVVTGVNLPMLIEALMNKQNMSAAELKEICLSAKDAIRSIREVMEDVIN